MLRATTPCTFSTSQLRKVLRTPQFLTHFTSKCASCHNGVHFFDISTSKSGPRPSVFNTFYPNVLRATTPCTFSSSQLSKVVRPWCALHIFTWKCASRHNAVHFFNISTSKSAPNPQFLTHFTSKCASRHNGVHFFDISTSKSAPRPPVFNTFYFQMCFAPQRRALFQHLNFQKWFDAEVFCTFSLRNRLRATTACNFSSLISPDVSAPPALASLLVNPPEPQNHEKHSVLRLSYLFAHLHLLSSDLFSSDSSPC